MALQLSETATSHIWRALPNHTPQTNSARWLLAGVALVSTLIAGGFTLVGAWMVLPFAGLEVGALWLALRHLSQHATDSEEIFLTATELRVVTQQAGKTSSHEFHSYWAQVRWVPASGLTAPARLFIQSHGREVEIGRLLLAPQKQALAQALRRQLQHYRQPEPGGLAEAS